MHLKSRSTSMMTGVTAWCLTMAFCGTAQAQDDGARAYWKTLEGTNFLSFQYLRFNADTDAQIYDPSLGIYPNSETDANFFLLSYGHWPNIIPIVMVLSNENLYPFNGFFLQQIFHSFDQCIFFFKVFLQVKFSKSLGDLYNMIKPFTLKAIIAL